MYSTSPEDAQSLIYGCGFGLVRLSWRSLTSTLWVCLEEPHHNVDQLVCTGRLVYGDVMIESSFTFSFGNEIILKKYGPRMFPSLVGRQKMSLTKRAESREDACVVDPPWWW
jgi:hypothetical protein